MAKELSTIIPKIRQFLIDTGSEFSIDEIQHHIDAVLVDISRVHPYVVKETVAADGTRDYSISSLSNFSKILEVVKAEYKVDQYPPQYRDVSRYGNTIRIDINSAPATGNNIYLWCHEIHEISDTSTTLDLKLQDVLIKGVVANAARAWLNQMRSDIVPASNKWYHDWVNEQFAIYQNALNSVTKPRIWEFYSRY